MLLCLFGCIVSAQNLTELEKELDYLAHSDLRYELVLKEIIEECKKTNQNQNLFQSYLKGINLTRDSNLKFAYSDSAINIAKHSGSLKLLVIAYQNMAVAYYIDKDYPTSLEYEFKALEILDKINEPYLYYKALYSIGAVQLYMTNYNDALVNFNKAKLYFKSFKNGSQLYGYFNSLRSEAICYYYLNDFTQAESLLNEANTYFNLLDNENTIEEQAYFNVTRAMVFYKQKKYVESLELLRVALNEIILNDDFANEHLIYFYLAKNYWKLNDKERAVSYFKKVDELFMNKGYTNIHFLEAYRFLIEEAKAKDNLKEQLSYTNRLLEATEVFRTTQSYLSDFLFKSFDTKQLLGQKKELEEQMAKKHLLWVGSCIAGIFLLLGILVFYLRDLRLKKRYKKNYDLLLKQLEVQQLNQIKAETDEDESWEAIIKPNYWQSYTCLVDEVCDADETRKEVLPEMLIQELNKKILDFEKEKLFLRSDFTLNDLADYCKTNRSYLSQYINTVKKISFPDYINTLRIHLLLNALRENTSLTKLKTEVIAQDFGYANRRSFANAFLKHTGVSYSYFLKELEKDEKMNFEMSI